MNCKKAEQSILLKDSGEILQQELSALAEHLSTCTPCQQFEQILSSSHQEFQASDEPSHDAIDQILRQARIEAPTKKRAKIWILKPAIAIAASLTIGVGLFFGSWNPNKVGMEWVITESQILSTDDQLASIMNGGFSEDDLAFNFLMTYDDR